MRNVHEIAQGLRARREGKLAAELADNSLRAESRFNAIYQELGVEEVVFAVTDDFRRNTVPFEHHSSRSIVSANPPYFHKETFFLVRERLRDKRIANADFKRCKCAGSDGISF